MNKKRAPYILIIVLIIILIFILGVRYGQKVEKTNKLINYLISLPPSPTVQPTQKPLEFKTLTNKFCGIRFLYPDSLTVIKESTTEAILTQGKENKLTVDCKSPNPLTALLSDQSIASEEITFKNKKISAKIDNTMVTNPFVFKFVNPVNNKTIYITIDKTLYPLFEKSLEFLP